MPIGDVDPEEYFLHAEMDEMRRVFDLYDADGSGSVSAADYVCSNSKLERNFSDFITFLKFFLELF